MRNLLGRLNGRTPDELARIARFWQVPAEASAPKHRLVGALYRTMTDPRGGRDAWDRLDDPERRMVTVLGNAESPLAIGDLARRLGIGEPVPHEIAARLYRAGIVARVGDDDPLPIGAVPHLFLPIEISQLFRRLRDERELGDVSGMMAHFWDAAASLDPTARTLNGSGAGRPAPRRRASPGRPGRADRRSPATRAAGACVGG